VAGGHPSGPGATGQYGVGANAQQHTGRNGNAAVQYPAGPQHTAGYPAGPNAARPEVTGQRAGDSGPQPAGAAPVHRPVPGPRRPVDGPAVERRPDPGHADGTPLGAGRAADDDEPTRIEPVRAEAVPAPRAEPAPAGRATATGVRDTPVPVGGDGPAIAAGGGGLVPWTGRGEGPGVQTIDLVKDYGTGSGAVRALAGITVSAERNRFTAIMGPSGSGKSTLLHCMAGLDAPTSGRVLIGATDLTQLPEKKLTKLRRDRVGFVFQSYALLPQLTVRQNITLPLEVAGRQVDDQWLKTVVEALDLGRLLKQRPTRLSGGQQQRVAMARALLPRPDVVFADEPTGALDAPTAREMLQFLRTSVRELGQTVVMVTHDPLAAEHTDHVLLLHRGSLAAQIANPTAPVVLDALTVLDRMPVDAWGPHPAARPA
jgi:putative ABC transport system ATP-binding protein